LPGYLQKIGQAVTDFASIGSNILTGGQLVI
jgi:hypothetical protein